MITTLILTILLSTISGAYQPDVEDEYVAVEYDAPGSSRATTYAVWACPTCGVLVEYEVHELSIFGYVFYTYYTFDGYNYTSQSECVSAIESSHTCLSAPLDGFGPIFALIALATSYIVFRNHKHKICGKNKK